MRIIAGRFKGRTLKGPPASGVRPTSDRLRETLFNILDITPAMRVLDGFAGTGALGLEALSRGAVHVTFIDRDARSIAVIRANVATCGAENACAIIRGEFAGGLDSLPFEASFELALLDPPYDFPDYNTVLDAAARAVVPGGHVVLEHSRRRESPERVGPLERYRIVTAGDSHLSFYRARPGATD
jgi:16S rRNA (guanine966-N2)-methyltransferase